MNLIAISETISWPEHAQVMPTRRIVELFARAREQVEETAQLFGAPAPLRWSGQPNGIATSLHDAKGALVGRVFLTHSDAGITITREEVKLTTIEVPR